MPPTEPVRDSGDTIIAIARSSNLKPLALDLGEVGVAGCVEDAQFKIRLANTEGRRSVASYLIKRRYAWRGYSVSNITTNLANRITLAAFDHEQAVATISVAVDSPYGLAVEALYPHEIRTLRTTGLQLCEFTKLAVENMVRSKAVLAAIFHIAYIYAHRIRGCTDLLIEVNPRHVRFYRSMLGFEQYGQQRIDPRVSAPAVLLRLELQHAEAEIARLGGHAELADELRLLYPLFFSSQEEQGIEKRLRSMD
jgi:hypothetical protein